VATVVVLLEGGEGEVTVGSRAVDQLARLGVTSLALLGDERTACVALDGWAFDAARSSNQVVSAVSGGACSARIFIRSRSQPFKLGRLQARTDYTLSVNWKGRTINETRFAE